MKSVEEKNEEFVLNILHDKIPNFKHKNSP